MEQSKFRTIMQLKRQGRYDECVEIYKAAIEAGDNDALIFSGLAKIFYLQRKTMQTINCNLIYFNLVLSYHGKNHICNCNNQVFHMFMAMRSDSSMHELMNEAGMLDDRKIRMLCNCESDYNASISGEDTSDEYEQLVLYFLNEDTLASSHTMGFVLSLIEDTYNSPLTNLLKIFPLFD